MARIQPAWLARQRARWLRPGARQSILSSDRTYAVALNRYSISERPNVEDILAARGQLLCFRQEITAIKAEFRFRCLFSSVKAGFRRDQPRRPKQSGTMSGQWSGGAGSATPGIGASKGKRPGHHYVPRDVYKKEPLKPETRRVFEDATTGRLRGQVHRGGDGHDEYNRAVREDFERFKKERGRSEDMTPERAQEFLDRVKRSTDPQIRDFNKRILWREIIYWIRRGPGRRE
jgi:hypothetical protein